MKNQIDAIVSTWNISIFAQDDFLTTYRPNFKISFWKNVRPVSYRYVKQQIRAHAVQAVNCLKIAVEGFSVQFTMTARGIQTWFILL